MEHPVVVIDKNVNDHLRDLSCVLSGQTAQRVVQILTEKVDALMTERMKLTNDYQMIERPLQKESKAFERNMKINQKTWERLSAQLTMFKDLERVLPNESPDIKLV